MYMIHLAAALQHIQLPNKSLTTAASLSSGTANEFTAPQPLDTTAPVFNTKVSSAAAEDTVMQAPQLEKAYQLLEKAYQLYCETCLSSDPQQGWTGLVEPSLSDALQFHKPDTQRLLDDSAIDPQTFQTYAIAYIHSLGLTGSADKLSSIQQATRRQRRGNMEARHCLYTAATAALQSVYHAELHRLEQQVDAALNVRQHQPAADASQPEAVIHSQHSGHELPAAHPSVEARQAIMSQQSTEGHTADVELALDQVPDATVTSEASAAAEQPHKELSIALFAFLKKVHSFSKPLKGVDVKQGLANPAHAISNELMRR